MDKQLLVDSLALVDLPDSGLTVRFYEVLFERYSSVRAMFDGDTRVQARRLRSAIVSVVDHVDDAEWLRTTLHARGGSMPGSASPGRCTARSRNA